ncbi:hypothetical protein ABC345_01525 [Shouchella sp. 1P09AA]|uniref:hypothetical protein n=1 Tax=Bacillaceae TaxID=186817 RepID=UPI0020D066C0|nr:hypothetical protein [Alkalihalobacillus sp. LMS6]UTR06734.1 hypothetical protein MM326_01525 [Alkalihalobacillus sp. LMS6]
MSDSFFGFFLALILVFSVYGIMFLIVKKKCNNVGWKPECLTILAIVAIFLIVIIVGDIQGTFAFFLVILISIYAVPMLAIIFIVKVILFYGFKKRF